MLCFTDTLLELITVKRTLVTVLHTRFYMLLTAFKLIIQHFVNTFHL